VRNHNDNSNFFCFGIGSSVNRLLLEGMAFMGNGEPMIVVNESKAEQQAEKFRNYINRPVLSQIKTDFGAIEAYDIEPGSTPDMLAERPIIIFGKYKGNRTGTITVSGKTGTQPYEKSFDLSAMKPNPAFSAIRYLWARERIKLLDYYSSNYQAYGQTTIDNFIKNEITQLGLKYGLMTQYTSFIAIDEDFRVDKDKKLVTVNQPLPLPQGVPNSAVGTTSSLNFTAPVIEQDDELKSQDEISNAKGIVSIATVTGGDDVNGKDIADVREVVTHVVEEKVWDVVEQMPIFPGGESELLAYVGKNLQYPVIAQENGIQGTVIVRFRVEKDGSVSNIQIVRSLDPACDKEAIRIVKSLPKFIPAKQNGVNVAVWYSFPVKFKLE